MSISTGAMKTQNEKKAHIDERFIGRRIFMSNAGASYVGGYEGFQQRYS
jgi:hypothetical protein